MERSFAYRTEGLPAMNEVNGRHFLVVTFATPVRWRRESKGEENVEEDSPPQGGYVVFALP